MINAKTTTRTDLRPFGSAPGNYYCKCLICNCRHISDKRAWRCEDCAILLKEEYEAKDAAYWENFILNHKGTD